jgi:transcriptional regulator with XRE-family HTH domain
MAERVSTDQQLAYVRDVLAISITDLAELLGVARPTIYAWMQGAAVPRDEHLLRLQQVEQQAREVEAFGLLMEAKLLKRPLRDGTTLLQRLNQRQPLAPALTELAELNRIERQQRASRKGHALGRTAAEAAADQSTPGFLTEA